MSDKIVLFGDSVAKGIVYDRESRRYVWGECSFIRSFCREHGYTLSDHSQFGCHLEKAFRLLKRHSADLADSRAVLVMLGGNDCNFDWPRVAENPDGQHECTTPPEQFHREYIRFLEEIRRLGGKPVMLDMAPVLGRRYYRWITRECDPDGIMQFLGCPERIEHWNEMYNLILQKIAMETGTPLVDVRGALLASRELENYYCPDGIHPDAEGHQAIFSRRDSDLYEAVAGA